MKVAVTVDDLPAHGALVPGTTRMAIAQGVIRALQNNGVTQAYGFCNGYMIAYEPGVDAVFNEWIRAGYPLGNHTYSHPDLDKVTVRDYIKDIEKMDGLLAKLAPVSPLLRQRRVFRYPFLAEGDTLAKRNEVRKYLFENGYRIAEVTIDYHDWAWNDAYIRCLAQHDKHSIAWLTNRVVDSAEWHLGVSSMMAELLFHRNISQILLVHLGAFEALTLDAVLKAFRARGVQFITLERALEDPAYKVNPDWAFPGGKTFLKQEAESRGVDTLRFMDTTYSIERLNEVCRQREPAK